MTNYEIKTISKLDADGNIYWTAFFPKIDGVVGGGSNEQEAINEAKENLKIYLWEIQNKEISKLQSELEKMTVSRDNWKCEAEYHQEVAVEALMDNEKIRETH